MQGVFFIFWARFQIRKQTVCLCRYEPKRTDVDEARRQVDVQKVNAELLKKLKELDTELDFSTGYNNDDDDDEFDSFLFSHQSYTAKKTLRFNSTSIHSTTIFL